MGFVFGLFPLPEFSFFPVHYHIILFYFLLDLLSGFSTSLPNSYIKLQTSPEQTLFDLSLQYLLDLR